MNIIRVQVNERDEGVIKCPQCAQEQVASGATELSHTFNTFHTVTCDCGHRFRVAFERRSLVRVKTALVGSYLILSSQVEGDLVVQDISLGGLSFETSSAHQIQVNDTLRVVYVISSQDQEKEKVEREVVVKRVEQKTIRAQFVDAPPPPENPGH